MYFSRNTYGSPEFLDIIDEVGLAFTLPPLLSMDGEGEVWKLEETLLCEKLTENALFSY